MLDFKFCVVCRWTKAIWLEISKLIVSQPVNAWYRENSANNTTPFNTTNKSFVKTHLNNFRTENNETNTWSWKNGSDRPRTDFFFKKMYRETEMKKPDWTNRHFHLVNKKTSAYNVYDEISAKLVIRRAMACSVNRAYTHTHTHKDGDGTGNK